MGSFLSRERLAGGEGVVSKEVLTFSSGAEPAVNESGVIEERRSRLILRQETSPVSVGGGTE